MKIYITGRDVSSYEYIILLHALETIQLNARERRSSDELRRRRLVTFRG